MRILVACEFSGIVRDAFIERGHDAISCDLLPTERPGPHYQGDVLDILSDGWDMMIAHPPCTFLSRAGQAWKTRKQSVRSDMKEYREAEAAKAIEFMKALWSAPIPKICLENPVGLANTRWRKPTQIIHPYYYGDGEMKQTCLWLKKLPRLNGLAHIHKLRDKPKPLRSRIGSDGKMKNMYFCGRMDNLSNAAKMKSKTFPGIARAMAEQWGCIQIY